MTPNADYGTLTVGSLFSGIGGIDLGLERAGMTVRWQSEIDPYACRVLARHWPHIPNLGDVRTVDWSTVEHVDLIAGGYPCQPFSLAGARGGDTDERHLWPWFVVALRHLRPRFALLENVPGHLSLGFGRVLGDLAELGYDTRWECVSAASVGAPHLRNRVFVVADATGDAWWFGNGNREAHVPDATRERDPHQPHRGDGGVEPVGTVVGAGDRVGRGDTAAGDQLARRGARIVGAAVADADRPRCPQLQRGEALTERTRSGAARDTGWWAVEPDVGRVAHGVPSRVDRLRCLGNAVVPQVAEYVGRQLLAATLPPNDGSGT